MRLLLISGLVFAGSFAKAQDNPDAGRIPRKYVTVFVEPIALIDFVSGPSYRFGLAYTKDKWSFYGTAGGYFQMGYIVRAGVKRYIKKDGNRRHYLALEYINDWHRYSLTDYYEQYDSTSPERYVIDANRRVSYTDTKFDNALSLQYGLETYWRHHWVLDFYAGAGIRYKNTSVSIPSSEQSQLYYFNSSEIYGIRDQPGSSVVPDIRLGIRIGHIFPVR